MKKVTFLSLALASLFSFSSHADIILSFDTPSSTVEVGEVFNIDLFASASEADKFSAFGLDIIFDTNAFTFDSATFGSMFMPSLDNGVSRGELVGFVPFGAVPSFPVLPSVFGDNLLLASLSFTAVMQGVFDFSIGSSATPAIAGFQSPPSFPNPIAPAVPFQVNNVLGVTVNATSTISAPASAALLLLSACALIIRRKR